MRSAASVDTNARIDLEALADTIVRAFSNSILSSRGCPWNCIAWDEAEQPTSDYGEYGRDRI